jgi:hypothetical protein
MAIPWLTVMHTMRDVIVAYNDRVLRTGDALEKAMDAFDQKSWREGFQHMRTASHHCPRGFILDELRAQNATWGRLGGAVLEAIDCARESREPEPPTKRQKSSPVRDLNSPFDYLPAAPRGNIDSEYQQVSLFMLPFCMKTRLALT